MQHDQWAQCRGWPTEREPRERLGIWSRLLVLDDSGLHAGRIEQASHGFLRHVEDQLADERVSLLLQVRRRKPVLVDRVLVDRFGESRDVAAVSLVPERVDAHGFLS